MVGGAADTGTKKGSRGGAGCARGRHGALTRAEVKRYATDTEDNAGLSVLIHRQTVWLWKNTVEAEMAAFMAATSSRGDRAGETASA
jgi:hypothetical protein